MFAPLVRCCCCCLLSCLIIFKIEINNTSFEFFPRLCSCLYRRKLKNISTVYGSRTDQKWVCVLFTRITHTNGTVDMICNRGWELRYQVIFKPCTTKGGWMLCSLNTNFSIKFFWRTRRRVNKKEIRRKKIKSRKQSLKFKCCWTFRYCSAIYFPPARFSPLNKYRYSGEILFRFGRLLDG